MVATTALAALASVLTDPQFADLDKSIGVVSVTLNRAQLALQSVVATRATLEQLEKASKELEEALEKEKK